jgi:hypothetical protein
MVAFVFCSLAGNDPRSLLGLIQILKFKLPRAYNLTCSCACQQREP